MKSFILVNIGLMVTITTATYHCPVTISADTGILEFAYSIQNFLYKYYQSVPANVTFFDELPTGSIVSPLNNQTLAANAVTNLAGLQNQAMLSVESLATLGSLAPNGETPSCLYKFPAVSSASTHINNAFYIEATLCGAFIGLADYAMSPTVAFLMARLAADHGTHAAFLRTYTQGTLFSATSNSLVPAFTPANITTPGSKVGNIGQYLGNCVPLPAAPCGGAVVIGSLNAMLVNQTVTSPVPACSSSTATTSTTTKTVRAGSSMTASATPVQFTSATARLWGMSWTWAGIVVLVAALI